MALGARVYPITSERRRLSRGGQAADARLRDLTGRSTSSGLAWARTAIPPRSSPGRSRCRDRCAERRARGRGDARSDAREAPVARVTLTCLRSFRANAAHRDHRPGQARSDRSGDRGRAASELPIGRVLAEAEQPIDIHWELTLPSLGDTLQSKVDPARREREGRPTCRAADRIAATDLFRDGG